MTKSHLHHRHKNIRRIEPTWLAHMVGPLTISLGLGLATLTGSHMHSPRTEAFHSRSCLAAQIHETKSGMESQSCETNPEVWKACVSDYTCIVIATLTAVLDPMIWLSHQRDRVTLWLHGLNIHSRESVAKALNTNRQLFFSLPYFISILSFPYFGFRTSAFSTYP